MPKAILRVFCMLLVAEGLAQADAATAAYRKYRGKIVVSEQALPDSGSEREFLSALAKLNRTVLKRTDEDQPWSFHFMAFLSKRAGASSINLVFYKTGSGKREYVGNKEINVGDPSSSIVVSSVDVSEEDGLASGGKYDVLIGRMVNGKETVYAATKLTFVTGK